MFSLLFVLVFLYIIYVESIINLLQYHHPCRQVTSVVSNSVRPQRRQPTRLPRPWDSPGKNTGVGCHCLLQGMKVKSQSEVAQSCLTLSDPMDCSPPGSSVHGIFQARVLEWGAIAYSVLQYSTIQYYTNCVSWVPRLTLLTCKQSGFMNALLEWNSFILQGTYCI